MSTFSADIDRFRERVDPIDAIVERVEHA